MFNSNYYIATYHFIILKSIEHLAFIFSWFDIYPFDIIWENWKSHQLYSNQPIHL